MDEQTYLAMVHVELDRAYRLAGLLLGRGGDAEDATHDAVLRGWRSSSSLRDPVRFQAWFDRIVINICRDRLRRARRIRFVDLGDASGMPAGEDAFDVVLAGDAIAEALATLDIDLRTIIVLRYWADLSIDQIAERLGLPAGTVKSRLHRALDQIRRSIADTAAAEATM
jgi:RNA polymerase sigma factor (sigma-70 family)